VWSDEPFVRPDEVLFVLDYLGSPRATRARMAFLVAARYGRTRRPSLRALARETGLSWQRVQQIINRGERLLRQPVRAAAWVILLERRPEIRGTKLYRATFPWQDARWP